MPSATPRVWESAERAARPGRSRAWREVKLMLRGKTQAALRGSEGQRGTALA